MGLGGQHGIDAVIQRVSSALGHLRASQHMVSTHQVTVEGDTATGRCYVLAQHVAPSDLGGGRFLVGGRYEDRYVRTGVGWRIAARRIVIMWTEGDPAVVAPRGG